MQLKKFESHDFIVIGILLLSISLAIVLPTLPQFEIHITERHGADAKFTILHAYTWLIFANLISIVSLISLNYSAGSADKTYPLDLAMSVITNDTVKDSIRTCIQDFNKSIRLVRWLTLIMILLLFGATCSIAILVIMSTPESGIPWRGLTLGMLVVSGPAYLLYMWHADALAAKSYDLMEDIRDAIMKLPNGEDPTVSHLRNHANQLLDTLAVYKKLVFVVDIPIFLGLVLIFVAKYVGMNGDSLYRDGFAIGAVAMHIIAANFISLALEKVSFGRNVGL